MRSCEKIGMIAGLADESVCPTLTCNGLHPGGAGAFACQPIVLQLLYGRGSVPNLAVIRIQVFGSITTDAGSLSDAISNRCSLRVISIFSIRSAIPTSRGKQYASPDCFCASSMTIFFAAVSYRQPPSTTGDPARFSHWSKNQRRSTPELSSITFRKSYVDALPSR